MKITLSGAFGLALLAASFTFGSAFACSQSLETTASELQTVATDNSANVSERVDAQPVEVDQSPSPVAAAVEPPETGASPPPAIQSIDAIVVEIIQSVTIAVPGQTTEDNETPTPAEAIAMMPSESPALQADPARPAASEMEPSPTDAQLAVGPVDAIVVEITQSVTIAVPGQNVEDSEEPVHTGSIPEPATADPVIVNAEATALDEAQ
jgi:hypothetical protein